MVPNSSQRRETTHVTVVGGGIGGLYAAYLLAHHPDYTVEVLDLARERLGGRITTREITVDNVIFRAEFGPMRLEPDLQTRFRRLCRHLGIGFTPFSPTGSPKILAEYDMTDIESSFDSAADLHKWAVLQMFFGAEKGKGSLCLPGSHDVEKALKSIDDAHTSAGSRDQIGPEQLRWLQCYLDDRVFLGVEGSRLAALDCDAMEGKLDLLRAEQHLRGDADNPLLRDIGLWHALSEVISPGAVAKIRDSGTFYHCIVNNPSAAEWGIFWLRQASALGSLSTFDATAEDGVRTVVLRLEAKLKDVRENPGEVSIHLGREVVQVEPAKRPTEVVLRVVEHDQSGSRPEPYSLRADHVILALPQWPLRRLAEHFPPEVTERIDGVEPLLLLKAFVVTKKPWWQPHFPAQSYAWQVPTRELHFYRGEKADCPSLHKPAEGQAPAACTCCEENGPGMIMLYTDEPAIGYWDLLVGRQERTSVLWHGPQDGQPFDAVAEVKANSFGLLDLLIRRLLVVPHPGLPYLINSWKAKFLTEAEEMTNEKVITPEDLAFLRQELGDHDKGRTDQAHLLGFSECILTVATTDADRELVGRVLRRIIPALPGEWFKYLEKAKEIRGRFITSEDVREEAGFVVAYGIRDWSAEPYGGAAHLWKPRFSPEPVAGDPLLAFSLRERQGGPRNVHICGEAFSGNQGFIEGALQTAEHVVGTIIGKDELKELLSKVLVAAQGSAAEESDDERLARLDAARAERLKGLRRCLNHHDPGGSPAARLNGRTWPTSRRDWPSQPSR
jgi:hypothetical protein